MNDRITDLQDFDSLYTLLDYFTSEEVCKKYLAVLRWGGEPACPYCGSVKINMLKGKIKRYKCYDCYSQFSVRVGTIFHNSKLPLRKWFVAIYLITTRKKGISSYQLARDLKITQKTAWFLLQRVRETYIPDDEIFFDQVEIDETFLGGKAKNKHTNKRTKMYQGRKPRSQIPVFGILNRYGKVYAVPVKDTTSAELTPIIHRKVGIGTRVYTDELPSYSKLSEWYSHNIICHSAREYVKGNTHTNGIENFWSILKRGIIGIYHQVSAKHLSRYVNEFTFRFNNRKLSESAKFDLALANCNVQLDYKTLIYGKGKRK